MLFETERLLARHLTTDDFDAMYAVYSDPDAMRWVDDGQPISREECTAWIEITQQNYARYGYGMSVFVLRETDEVIGFCGIVHPGGQPEAENKYALLRDFWGRGLATEGVGAMLAYGAQTFGLREIIATIAPENAASRRVLLKSGMKFLENLPNGDGTFTEVLVWRSIEHQEEG